MLLLEIYFTRNNANYTFQFLKKLYSKQITLFSHGKCYTGTQESSFAPNLLLDVPFG